MPDPVPPPIYPPPLKPDSPSSSHLQGWAALLLAAAALVGSIGGVITGIVSIVIQKDNTDTLGNVQSRQAEQVETAESVKAALEKKAKADRQALETNLRSSWKYLESIADDSGLPKDREAANSAKRVYDEFKAKGNGSP